MNRKRVTINGTAFRRWLPVRLILLVLFLLLTWQLIVELVEPQLFLYIDDWLRPKADPLQVSTVGGTNLRLYRDTRPHVGKIAGLQKGLIWVLEGQELVEEGYGFGCPIIEVAGRAYISRHAEIERVVQEGSVRLTKRYNIDTIDTPTQPFQRKYRPTSSLGTVTFVYDIYPDGRIDIAVDFGELQVTWDRAYLMNEQGSNTFTRYRDEEGTVLEAHEIGIWKSTGAERACFESEDGGLSFCIEVVEAAEVYYGRERYNQYNWRGTYYLSWSGIDIAVEGPRQQYHYRVFVQKR
jgi:hypothetical protein